MIRLIVLSLLIVSASALASEAVTHGIRRPNAAHEARALFAALLSRDASQLRNYLACKEPWEVAVAFEQDLTLEIEGFPIRGTPLSMLARLGRINAIRDLLKYSDNNPEFASILFRRDAQGSGPLHVTLDRRAHANAVVRLPEGLDFDFEVIEQPLSLPDPNLMVKKSELVKAFSAYLERRPNHVTLLMRPNADGETPLHVAVASGWCGVARTLLSSTHADLLLNSPQRLDVSTLNESAQARMLRELLLARPGLLRHFADEPQLANARVLEFALAERDVHVVEVFLAFAREYNRPDLVRIDLETLKAQWSLFEVVAEDEDFAQRIWLLDWTEFDGALETIRFAWDQRLYPQAFAGNRVLINVVLAAHMGLQITGKLQWPN